MQLRFLEGFKFINIILRLIRSKAIALLIGPYWYGDLKFIANDYGVDKWAYQFRFRTKCC